MTTYRAYFGLKSDPFATDVATKDLLRLPGMLGVKERLDYVIQLGGVLVVTGEVGSGKSTSLRWSLSHYHQSEVQVVAIVANTGSIVELLRLVSWGFDLNPTTSSAVRTVRRASTSNARASSAAACISCRRPGDVSTTF